MTSCRSSRGKMSPHRSSQFPMTLAGTTFKPLQRLWSRNRLSTYVPHDRFDILITQWIIPAHVHPGCATHWAANRPH